MANNQRVAKVVIRIPLYRIKLIDFSQIFQKYIEPDLITELHTYNLIRNDVVNIKSRDVKQLFYHHIIYNLCTYILSVKGKDKIVVVYSDVVTPSSEIHKYINIDDLQTFLNKFILKLIKLLPVKILIASTTFHKIRSDIRNKTGDSIDTINSARSIVENHDISRYTFSKARNFSNRYGLTFLSNDFFQQIKSKQLILS